MRLSRQQLAQAVSLDGKKVLKRQVGLSSDHQVEVSHFSLGGGTPHLGDVLDSKGQHLEGIYAVLASWAFPRPFGDHTVPRIRMLVVAIAMTLAMATSMSAQAAESVAPAIQNGVKAIEENAGKLSWLRRISIPKPRLLKLASLALGAWDIFDSYFNDGSDNQDPDA